MVKILCVFERIGGISGKRIHIRRIMKIGFYQKSNKIRPDSYSRMVEDDIILHLNKNADVLNADNDGIQLDEFMMLMNNQGERYDEQRLKLTSYVGFVEYVGGKIIKLGLLPLSKIVSIIGQRYGSEVPLKDIIVKEEYYSNNKITIEETYEGSSKYVLKNPYPIYDLYEYFDIKDCVDSKSFEVEL